MTRAHLRRLAVTGLALSALAVCACERREAVAVAGAAAPTVDFPVGPIPGPEQARPIAPNPYEGDEVALRDGRRLFVSYNCEGCHGGHGGGGMGPSLRDVTWIYGSSDAAIFDSIAEGRAHGMPSWGSRLPREQIWKLTLYIRSLRTPREPEKPQ